MRVDDILIQSDDAGGIIVLREGNDPDFIKHTQKNSVRCSAVMAKVMQAFRDDILELQGKPLAKKKAKA
jgi:hypothetical protein